MIGRIFISICAAILVVGIGFTVYGYTRGPEYDRETGDMFVVLGIGMTFVGGLSTGLLGVTMVRMRKYKG